MTIQKEEGQLGIPLREELLYNMQQSKLDFPYMDELSHSLEQVVGEINRGGQNIRCLVLFGSLSRNRPRIDHDANMFLSDADVMVLVDDQDEEKFHSRCLYFGNGFMNTRPLVPFAPH